MKSLLIFIILISNLALAQIRLPSDEEVLVLKNIGRQSSISIDQEIKFLVWNIFKGAKDNFYRIFPDVARDHDFILMQEANYDIPFEVMLGEFFRYEFSMSQSFFSDEIGTGVALLSRYQSEDIKWVRSKAREPFIGTPKMFQLNKINIQGSKQKLLIVNIHGINFVKNSGFYSQVNQLEEAMENHNGPIILGGDFNTWNNRRFNFLKKMASKISLKQVVFENAKVLKKFMGNTLDHVFTRGLNLIKARADRLKDASDHSAMILNLKIIQ